MSLAPRLPLDLGGIEQGSNDCCRADTHRDAGLHQLVPALLVRAVVLVVAITHDQISMAFGAGLEVA